MKGGPPKTQEDASQQSINEIKQTLVDVGRDPSARVSQRFFHRPAGNVSTNPDDVLKNGNYAYRPAQLRAAYGVTGAAGNGTGQTIAIVDAFGSPNVQQDATAFYQKFFQSLGYPAPNVEVSYPQGQIAFNYSVCTGANLDAYQNDVCGWSTEIALDVQWAYAMAPGAKILLVAAKDDSLANLLGAVTTAAAKASIVSMSWGTDEFASTSCTGITDPNCGERALDNLVFANFPGVTFLASAGDASLARQWPAASPFVLSVGGTHLEYDPTATPPVNRETAWNDTGGGLASFEGIPSYQTGRLGSVTEGNPPTRAIPDVAFDADPSTGVYVCDHTNFDNACWIIVGGTSLGSPAWAGLLSLVNAKLPSGSTLGDAHSVLYAASASAGFRDITQGCFTGSPACTGNDIAQAGYDLMTGLGSPAEGALLTALAAPPPDVALTVTKGGTGAGTVSSAPAGIDCGTTCSASFAANTAVTLSAMAATGSSFTGWGGACSGTGTCMVTLANATAVTATFDTAGSATGTGAGTGTSTGSTGSGTGPFTLTVTKTGDGSGQVLAKNGISCGSQCTATVYAGTTVTLSALPDVGSIFGGWGGPCSGMLLACTFTVSQDTTVTATFKPFSQLMGADLAGTTWTASGNGCRIYNISVGTPSITFQHLKFYNDGTFHAVWTNGQSSCVSQGGTWTLSGTAIQLILHGLTTSMSHPQLTFDGTLTNLAAFDTDTTNNQPNQSFPADLGACHFTRDLLPPLNLCGGW